jgi:stearoyl-CoA desaturase (delta-9 desaturase)
MAQENTSPDRRFRVFLRWFDTEAGDEAADGHAKKDVDWLGSVPLILLHAGCLGVFFVGWSPVALVTAVFLYLVRMFSITGFYHRYFSHKAYKTNRFWQFVFAVLGNSSAQQGPIWWAAHHRHHHRYADKPEDVHSPQQHGFWWSHIGWLASRTNVKTKTRYVKDWLQFPELRWINRFDKVVPITLAMALFFFGALLNAVAPGLNTSGWQMLVWGFFISSTVLLHATLSINSVDHMFGSRRYDTGDTSRNNPILALLTLGEGWHNNHHHYAVSARQGFYWWEVDITYYILLMLSWLGIVWDLRPVPDSVKSSHRTR